MSRSKKKKTLIQNKQTTSTIIKNSNLSGRDNEHWPALACFGRDGRYSTLAGRQNWLELLHIAKKHLKNYKR
jgi:hypothetical protein